MKVGLAGVSQKKGILQANSARVGGVFFNHADAVDPDGRPGAGESGGTARSTRAGP